MKIPRVWLVCTLLFVTLLNAQALLRVDERVEAPIEVSVNKSEEPNPKKDKKSQEGMEPEKFSDKKPEKIYPVSRFIISYCKKHPDLPLIEQLEAIEINLNLKDGNYTAR